MTAKEKETASEKRKGRDRGKKRIFSLHLRLSKTAAEKNCVKFRQHEKSTHFFNFFFHMIKGNEKNYFCSVTCRISKCNIRAKLWLMNKINELSCTVGTFNKGSAIKETEIKILLNRPLN